MVGFGALILAWIFAYLMLGSSGLVVSIMVHFEIGYCRTTPFLDIISYRISQVASYLDLVYSFTILCLLASASFTF